MSYFQDVEYMFDTHDISHAVHPELLSKEDMEFRTMLHMEELMEFTTAIQDYDIVGAADALADLVYVVLGTAVRMGLPFDAIWQVIHATNVLQKRRGGVSKRGGNDNDLVRLEHYVDPKQVIAKILEPDLADDIAVVLFFNINLSTEDVITVYSHKYHVCKVFVPFDADIDVNDVIPGDLIKFNTIVQNGTTKKVWVAFV